METMVFLNPVTGLYDSRPLEGADDESEEAKDVRDAAESKASESKKAKEKDCRRK